MSKTAIVRKIDDLGRLVLPKDIRRILNFHTGDLLELRANEDSLSITKYSSVEDIRFLSEILLNAIYEKYRVEGILVEEEKIVSYPTLVSLSKLEEKKDISERLEIPILREEKEIAKIFLFTQENKYQELLSFLSLFLKKYLEEC